MDIKESLCVYDPRSDCYDQMAFDDAPPPRQPGCPCDRCFYGRDVLAVEVERLRSLLAEARHAIERHKSNIWGTSEANHPEDDELYDFLDRIEAGLGGARNDK